MFSEHRKECAGSRIALSKGVKVEMDGKDLSDYIFSEEKVPTEEHDYTKFYHHTCMWVKVHLNPGPHILGLRYELWQSTYQ